MKSILLVWLFGFALQGIVAQEADRAFEEDIKKATEAYDAGNYEEAFTAWIKLAPHSSDPDLFYNIGNSALLAGKIPEAIYAYEQFLRFRPGNKEVKELIINAREQIENGVSPLPKFFLSQWLRAGLSLLRPGSWAILSLLTFLIAVAIWLSRLGQLNYLSSLQRQRIMIFISSGILFLLLALLSYRQIHRKNEAVVFTACEMYQGPSIQSPLARTIYPGEKVIIKDKLSGWKKITLLNLDQGWIRDECIRIIEFETD